MRTRTRVSRTTSATRYGGIGASLGGRVLSRRRPSIPSAMNRSCQRQTVVFDVPVSHTAAGRGIPKGIDPFQLIH
jgi:hypothetical protein